MSTKEHVPKTLCFNGFSAWFVLIYLVVGGLILCLWLLWKFKEGPFYNKKNRIDGKVVIITGCNTGIGKETASEMARRGGRIYMACRNATRCEEARLEIIERTGNQNVFNRTLNLASLSSVRNFVMRFLDEEDRLDILINNAGIFGGERSLTVDGYEQQFAVNHLGHFLLTNLLLTRLRASAPSRVIVLTSIFYMFGNINKEDLNGEVKYSKFRAHAQSKLANLLFTQRLSEILQESRVSVNAAHPGIVNTDFWAYKGRLSWLWNFFYFFLGFLMKTPRAGAQTTIRLALDPDLAYASGGFYADTFRWPVLPRGKDKQMANWLWIESDKMVGLRPRTAKEETENLEGDQFGSIVINNL